MPSIDDPLRIDLRDPGAIAFWTVRFGVSEDELRHLVRRFGFVPYDIDDALGVVPDDPRRSL